MHGQELRFKIIITRNEIGCQIINNPVIKKKDELGGSLKFNTPIMSQ